MPDYKLDCFALQKDKISKCAILKLKGSRLKCSECRFYKTKEEYKKGMKNKL